MVPEFLALLSDIYTHTDLCGSEDFLVFMNIGNARHIACSVPIVACNIIITPFLPEERGFKPWVLQRGCYTLSFDPSYLFRHHNQLFLQSKQIGFSASIA